MSLRRLQRYLNKQSDLSDGQKTFKRITVAEPQGESHGNSWHLHILLIFEDVAPFLSNEEITELWGHGMPLFSASRGMKRPVVEKISNKEAMERVSDCKLVYQETFLIGDKEKNGNIIDKKYYKKE